MWNSENGVSESQTGKKSPESKICTFVYYQINNENLKNEVKNAERREEIIKQVQQENQSKFSIYTERLSQYFIAIFSCNKKKLLIS